MTDSLIPPENLWIVVSSFVVSFVLAGALGANDVANSFATSVGSKVITLRTACILGTVFETLGAILLGARVSDTIRKGIIDVTAYDDSLEILLVGYLSALVGAAVWLLIATVLKLPVSGTHSIIGATIGFALVAKGPASITWLQVGLIAASWVISPLLSGIVSILVFLVVKFLVLRKTDKLVAGLKLLPVFYGMTLVVNAFSIFYKGPEQLYLDRIPLWGSLVIAFGSGTIAAILIRLVFVPWQREKILDDLKNTKDKPEMLSLKDGEGNGESSDAVTETAAGTVVPDKKKADKSNKKSNKKKKEKDPSEAKEDEAEREDDSDGLSHDPPAVSALFSKLQILTAIFGAFAHGGNDVSNAIGPLVAVWLISIEGNVLQKAATPIWILFYGGAGITIGLWALGRRVIETMGSDLTKLTPSSGFSIEIGSALTVLIASNIGIPISSTHCKVGSVVCVGRVRSKDNVDWKLFVNIIIAWVVTLPAAGLVSAGVFYGLTYLVPPLGPPWNMPVLNSTAVPNATFY